MNRVAISLSSLNMLLSGNSIEPESREEQDTIGTRIVSAADHDRWKEAHEEVYIEVKCSAEEIIVNLKGVIAHQMFQLNDPHCRLKPVDRNTQTIHVNICSF